MKRDVLDQNLELLLQRAYVPVRPAPAFTTRLAAELARRRTARGLAFPRQLARAAAALVLVAGLAWIAVIALRGTTTALDRDTILSGGACAVRTGAEPWRALDERLAAHGIEHASGTLELATPERARTRIWFGSDGSAALEPRTHVTADFDATHHALTLVLHAGAVAVERLAVGGVWRIATSEGGFELQRGLLELARIGPEFSGGRRAVRARLVTGAARFAGTAGSVELVPGRTYVARDGALRDVDLETALAHDPAERTLAGTTPPEEPDAPAEESTAARARLELRFEAAGSPLLGRSGTATVLRETRLPAVSRAVRRAIDPATGSAAWESIAPGTYEVFVDVPGLAPWRTNDLFLASGDVLVLTVELHTVGARVRGRVLDAATGAPIENAQLVSETDAPTAVLPFDLDADPEDVPADSRSTTRTGPDGRFELNQLSPGRHVVRAWAPGRGAEWSGELDLAAGAEPTELVFRLARGGAIEGRFADEFGRPQTDARMIVSRLDFGAPRRVISYSMSDTDAAGNFTFVDLAGGLYTLLAFVEPVPMPSLQQVVVRPGETLRIDLPGAGTGTTLRGRLVHADGRAAADVDVSIQRTGSRGKRDYRNERTDAEGRFVFHGLAAEPHDVFAGLDLGARLSLLGVLDVPIVNEFQREFVLPTHSVEGTVRDSTGRPCPNAAVLLERETDGVYRFGSRSAADAQGNWRADFLAPGRWRARAYGVRGALAPVLSAPFQIEEDAASPHRVDFELVSGASLSIRVRSKAGIALRGTDIAFEDEHGIAWEATMDDTTNAEGVLRVPGLAAGAWIVRVSREGFAPAEARIRLEAGDEHELDLVLEPAVEKQ